MSKNYTMKAIAEALDGRLIGDGTLPVSRVAHPSDIRDGTDLILAVDNALLPVLASSGAKLAILSAKSEAQPYLSAAIVVDRPRLAMARLTALFAEPVAVPEGVHPTAIVEAGVKLGANVSIGAYCFIASNASIGANSVVHPQCYIGPDAVIGRNALVHAGVKIGAKVVIGDNFIIHFNSSIGADGFSFVTPQPGSVEEAKDGASSSITASNTELVRIASLGGVVIGDDVEVGANSSIDRGTISATRVGNGTKIDNQVQVGHNVVIGENCLICGRVGIAGSAVIGDRVVLGGASGVGDHVKMGNDSVAMAMAGIAGNVPERLVVGGMPAMKREKLVENIFNVGRIRQLIAKINVLTERVNELDKK